MNNSMITRLRELEARFERLLFDFQGFKAQVASLINQVQTQQSGGGGPQNGGGGGGLFWAHAPSTIAAATGSWATISPTTFTSDIYADVGGTLALQASSQTVNWFYKDSAAINSLIPVEPINGGSAWTAIGNSCTAV